MSVSESDLMIYKCGIISEILEGREPNPKDFISNEEGGLSPQDFVNLIFDMQNNGLIDGAVFATKDKNTPLIQFLNQATVTERGKIFLQRFLNKM